MCRVQKGVSMTDVSGIGQVKNTQSGNSSKVAEYRKKQEQSIFLEQQEKAEAAAKKQEDLQWQLKMLQSQYGANATKDEKTEVKNAEKNLENAKKEAETAQEGLKDAKKDNPFD